jgi:hypothetical protein
MVMLLFLALPGCGVFLPYLYDAETLDNQLSISMTKANVLKQLGKPHSVVQDNGQQLIWEYRFYAKREWIAYLVHCPFHLNCYFPVEAPAPYYVAFRNEKLCLWGTPDVVRTLARTVCPSELGTREFALDRMGSTGGMRLSVVPVFMPPRIFPPPNRLAILPVRGDTDDRLTSWLDLTLNFLRARHPPLVLVEREDLQAVFDEVMMQYSGRVDEETMTRVGRLTGADSLLLHRLNVTKNSGAVSASFELRMIGIESGTTLFRQLATVTAVPLKPQGTKVGESESQRLARQIDVEEAAAYGLAALAAAFGDNPLGIVPDHTWSGEGVKLIGLLEDGPASRSGLKQGDRILTANGQPFRYWMGGSEVPTALTVERDGITLDLNVVLQPYAELNRKEISN